MITKDRFESKGNILNLLFFEKEKEDKFTVCILLKHQKCLPHTTFVTLLLV